MNFNQFKNLSLNEPILRALSEEGYYKPTAIQLEAIPQVFAGKDLIATAQTGTGKTAAFALPILQMLYARRKGAAYIRALILTPTRELALQIHASLITYGRHLPLTSAVVLGGVSPASQISAIRKNPDILVSTPGRLLDLFGQGHVRLNHIEMLVLDEADRMLDMGFVYDVRKIVSKLPSARQTLFFSATMSFEIAELASGIVKNPVKVEVTPPASVTENIEQKVFFVEQMNKHDLLTCILKDKQVRRALVFARTKRHADRIMRQLSNKGISVEAIHSGKTQSARQRALSAFDCGRIKVLVGTDIVARGIDVKGISHVINYSLPNEPESYIHRIGRTARAGSTGIALSFCDAEEIGMLKGIEKLTKCSLTVVEDHPFHSPAIAELKEKKYVVSSSPPRFRGRVKQKNHMGRRAGRYQTISQ